MATLDQLMQIKGVMAAGEFTPTGELVDFRSAMSMSQDQAGMTAQFCNTVSIMLNTLAKAYSHMYTNMSWLPPKFWAYGGAAAIRPELRGQPAHVRVHVRVRFGQGIEHDADGVAELGGHARLILRHRHGRSEVHQFAGRREFACCHHSLDLHKLI